MNASSNIQPQQQQAQESLVLWPRLDILDDDGDGGRGGDEVQEHNTLNP
jgi:hypothetical protein